MSLFSEFSVNILERYFHLMKLQIQNAVGQPENFVSSQVGFNQSRSQLGTKKDLGMIDD